MRLILAGCEYSGTSTLANAISEWAAKATGISMSIHDHFQIPYVSHHEMTDEELEAFLALPPHLKQGYQWHALAYHSMPAWLQKEDYILVGFQTAEAVYSPLYYGYGRPWEYAQADILAHHYEVSVMKSMPYIVQVLVEASPEVIAKRMKENPHKYGLLQENDIEHVLQRFKDEHTRSLVRRKNIILNTSEATVDETVADFVEQMERWWSEYDLQRLVSGDRSA